ncbi:MAG: radical SAM protein [Deltaproteobacteria bacterium]|nr:radical SAM protein [Deltaproteobacteria bacterium]
MRILLISPNRLRLVAPPLPLALACLAASWSGHHEVYTLDLMFADDPEGALSRALADSRPELAAVSLRNLDNQDSRHPESYYPEVRDLIRRLRSMSNASLLVGGSGFSLMPRELLAYLEADFGLAGEGELSVLRFLEDYPHGAWRQTPGLVYRGHDGITANPPALVARLEDLPDPALEVCSPVLYHEAEGSAKLAGVIPVQTRRGCPMRCIYCTTPRLEGRRLRAWPPERVAGWLARWHEKWGLTRFYFVDSLFNHPQDYARRLCQALLELRLPLEWAAIINPAFPDGELFHLMRRAGAVRVQVGNESGSELVLQRLGKGFGRDQVVQTLSLLEEAGLAYACFLLLGGPGENRRTVAESIDLMERFHPLLVNLTVGIRIYPGTEMHRLALDAGMVQEGESLLRPAFYLEPGLEPWIWEHLAEVQSRHPTWIF